MDPYERGMEEGGNAIEFLARNIWLLVPIQGKIKAFLFRLQSISLSGRKLSERRRHQLRHVAAAGRPEAAQRFGAPRAAIKSL